MRYLALIALCLASAGCDVICGDLVACGGDGGTKCKSGPCAPCTAHHQCDSLVCDVYQTTPQGPGLCLDQAQVVYVNNAGPCGTGGKGDPVCSLTDAVAHLGGKSIIRVLPSATSYGQLSLSAGDVRLYGPAGDGGVAKLAGGSMQDALSVSGTASVLVDGWEIDTAAHALQCQGAGASLVVRRTVISDTFKPAIGVSDCSLTVDRTRISGGRDIALDLGARSRYAITNSFIVANTVGSPDSLVRMANDSTGTFQYNTVAGNMSASAGGIDCGLVQRGIQDSIVWGNTTSFQSSQLFGSCLLTHVVVGATDLAPGGSAMDPDFVSPGAPNFDYHLKDSAADAACCIDKAQLNPNVFFDYDGNPRPRVMGGIPDIGAHEVR